MAWDDDNHNDKGPWGQAPRGNDPKNNKPTPNQPDDIDEIIRKSQEKIKSIFSGGGGGGGYGGKKSGKPPLSGNKVAGAMVAIVIGLWLASGIYTVDTKEVGVVLRFGEYIGTTKPGINYHLPAPIERVLKLKVTDRYRTQIGLGSGSNQDTVSRRRGRRSQGGTRKEILMLTGDENIVSVESVEVQWQIDDPEKFLFRVYNPEKTVRDSAESAMREVVGTTPLNDILSDGREKVQLDTKELLQNILDPYNIGIKVEAINMVAVPPRTTITVENFTTDEEGETQNQTITTTVDEAFKDVQAAITDKESFLELANAREREIKAQSTARAEKVLLEAQGYREKVIANAQGQAKRFISIYNEYKKAKDVTKRRIYLETMEDVLSGMDKIVLDSQGGVVPYLPINELKNKR